jgi:hypothetical protein
MVSTFLSGLSIEINMKVGKSPARKIEDLMRVLRAL